MQLGLEQRVSKLEATLSRLEAELVILRDITKQREHRLKKLNQAQREAEFRK